MQKKAYDTKMTRKNHSIQQSINALQVGSEHKKSKSVFQDLGFSEEESAGLKLKSYLFMALQEAIRNSNMTQKEVADIN